MTFPARLPIPEEVLQIARTLEESGFETWCVGGAIRDNLLGFENQDFDLATAARPEDITRLFKRTVPVGIEHGTVAVLDRKNRPHEVTTFRRDVTTDGRHAVVAFGVSLEEDLARRDFTLNAIAYHPFKHEWRDPFEGQRDIERKLIRAVGDPAERFREDYLRILRLLRFAARFGFTIDQRTWEAARENREGLKRLSAERVRDEWFKGLVTALKPSELVRLWGEVVALETWLPECAVGGSWYQDASGEAVRGARHAEAGAATPHDQSAERDAATVLDQFDQRDPVLFTAYLSADPVATLTRLKCSRADIERGRRLAAHRGNWPNAESPVEVRRWMSAAGAAVDDLVAIAKAEGRGGRLTLAVDLVRRSGAPLSLSDLAITGDDLLKAGVPKGPAVGQALRGLLERVIENPELNDRAHLLALAREIYSPSP